MHDPQATTINVNGQVHCYALHERYVSGETRTLTDYGLPTTTPGPPAIGLVTVEYPVLGGPLGVKGVAEMTESGGVASASNAVAAASVVRCYRATARQDLITEAIRRGGDDRPVFLALVQTGGSSG